MEGIIYNLHWNSDWNGEEVGFPEYGVVGHYSSHALGVDVYMDMETNMVIRIMPHEEEDF